MARLGVLERDILEAIEAFPDRDLAGGDIAAEIGRKYGRKQSVPSTYTTLTRLEDKGLVSVETTEPIEQLVSLKDLFIQNSGTDNDEGPMSELVPDSAEEDVLSDYFDLCIETFRLVSRSGHLTLYRAISVDDVDAFVAAVEKGAKVGSHWTYHDHAASTSYHSEQQKEHLLMLVCEAPVSSVDWSTSLQQHFSHPYEHEIFVTGPVKLTMILDEHDQAIAEPNKIVKT